MNFGAYNCDTCQIIQPVPESDMFRYWGAWIAKHGHALESCSENERDTMDAALELATKDWQCIE